MSFTKVVVAIQGNQDGVGNLLLDIFTTEYQVSAAEEGGHLSNMMEEECEMTHENLIIARNRHIGC